MADVYRVLVKLVVFKGLTEEVIVSEEFFFPGVGFRRMANVTDAVYEVVAKLQKEKS